MENSKAPVPLSSQGLAAGPGVEERLTAKLVSLGERIDALEKRLDVVAPLAIRGYVKNATWQNCLYHDEDDLEEVPFPDGRLPWGRTVEAPMGLVVLPRLTSLDSVSALSEAQTYGYFAGYYPAEAAQGGMPTDGVCKERILEAIGWRGEERL